MTGQRETDFKSPCKCQLESADVISAGKKKTFIPCGYCVVWFARVKVMVLFLHSVMLSFTGALCMGSGELSIKNSTAGLKVTQDLAMSVR